MKLIVGLGNPGSKYTNTRHNVGFRVVDALMRQFEILNLKFLMNDKFSAETCFFKKDILLVKPQTFMNGSGGAVAKLATFYKLLSADIWVIHDDVDIPLGKMKIRIGGSGAGHHGVESIIESLGTDKFVRFRLGIGHPGRGKDGNVEEYVIKEFDINEKTELKHLLKRTVEAIEVAIKDGIAKAMNRYNG